MAVGVHQETNIRFLTLNLLNMLHIITCRFCGAIGGTIDLPDKIWQGIFVTNENIGIEDHRCNLCSSLHGKYKDLHIKYEKDVGGTYQEFLSAAKLGDYKQGKFAEVIDEIKAGKRSKSGIIKNK